MIKKITARLQELSQEDIKKNIDPKVYSKIKETDAHPEFRSYVIGHEGLSEGRFLGFGNIVKKWFKSAIEALNNKLQIGTKVFNLHTESNEHAGRTPIGEVVGKALKQWGETLYTYAVMYILPEFRGHNLDVASIEADIDIPAHDLDNVQVHGVDVHRITGIALGDSTKNKPGFAGATLTARLQEFTSLETGSEGELKMTVKEIIDGIKANGLSVSDVFSMDQIEKDSTIVGFIKEKNASEYQARKRVQGEFEQKENAYKDKIKALETEVSTAKVGTLKIQAKDKFAVFAKDRKLTEQQEKFIMKDIDAFTPENEEKLDENINSFMDKKLIDFKAVSEIFGYENKDDADDKSGNIQIIEENDDGLTGEDLIDPSKNDFIPD